METLTKTVVLFSKNYLSVNKIRLERAVALLVTGKAESVSFSQTHWETGYFSLTGRVPAYSHLHQASERMWKISVVSRRKVSRRDSYQCQYCGNKKHLII